MRVDTTHIFPPELAGAANEAKKAYLLADDERRSALIDRMLAWAEDHLGDAAYAGWCLSFAEDALEESSGIEVFGGDSARASCEMYRDALRGGEPERGAFVFYDCLCPGEDGPVNWGHCGLSLGRGQVIHAWNVVRIDDWRAIEALTALSGDHPRYLGWVPVERVMEEAPE